MKGSKIEWTDDSDNPVMTADGSFYCFKVSEACDHCYAEGQARRLSAMRHTTPRPYKKVRQFPPMQLKRDMLAGWARQTKAKKHFVSSMTDIAGEFVPDEWFYEIMDAMRAASLQTFQVLTKRASRYAELSNKWIAMRGLTSLPPNIWPGVSVETMRRANERIPYLLSIPSYYHWISAEPLLEHLDLHEYLYPVGHRPPLNWVVTGGESGHKARISHPGWFRSLRDQCANADNVAFFFKQWGEWCPETLPGMHSRMEYIDERGKIIQPPDVATIHAQEMYRIGKHNAGHHLDGAIWQNFPTARLFPVPEIGQPLPVHTGSIH
jgi:protein gp37